MVDSSSSWLRTEFWIVMVAMFGGAIVLVGLWLEYIAEKNGQTDDELFKHVNDFRLKKSLGKAGEIIVMIGIIWEILTAGFFAYREDWHIRQIEIKAIQNDPLNKLFFKASANVEIKILKNKFFKPNLDKPQPTEDWQVLQAHLELRSLKTNILLGNIPLSAFSNDIKPEVTGNVSVSNSVEISRESNFGYKLQFSYEEYPGLRKSFDRAYGEAKWPTAGQVLTNFNVLQITENFIPVDTEVVGGSVDIVINDIHTNFEILPQRVKASINKGDTFIIQTNMLP